MSQKNLIFFGLVVISLMISLYSSQQLRKDEFKSKINQKIQQLQKDLRGELYDKNTHFTPFPPKFDHQKGLYGSYIHGNIIDKDNSYLTHLIRTHFKCDDNNMFVSNFVLMALLDSYELRTIDLQLEEFEWTIDAILEFRDKNKEQGIPVYSFWSQKLINGTWGAAPSNLEHVAQLAASFPPWLKKWLDAIGYSYISHASEMSKVFRVPPDADDSSVNIALGQKLKQFESLTKIEQKWNKMNFNISAYYELLKSHAYRPFANLTGDLDKKYNNTDIIDPRSYLAFYDFFDEQYQIALKEQRKPMLSFFSTWILNYEEQVKDVVTIPAQTNNIDVSVNANAIFGLNNLLINDKNASNYFDQELQGMYLNATNLIAYTIKSGRVIQRPDIVMLYYPSVFDFYWFAARNAHLLNSYDSEIRFEVMRQARDSLNQALRNQGTYQILSEIKYDKQGYAYWEEFLGDYAGKVRGEDRNFASALALNALIDIWTISEKDQKTGKIIRQFIQNTPQNVTDAIDKGVQKIINYKPNFFETHDENVFFSGSLKNNASNQMFMPSNFNNFANGTSVNPHTTVFDWNFLKTLRLAVKGFIPKDQYEQMIQETWFQEQTPVDFPGYNVGEGFTFPYWSSPAITYSMSLLALSKHISLIN
ncbi:hypothetical protein ABPG72_005372 [Tetrahymena utriculariae]